MAAAEWRPQPQSLRDLGPRVAIKDSLKLLNYSSKLWEERTWEFQLQSGVQPGHISNGQGRGVGNNPGAEGTKVPEDLKSWKWKELKKKEEYRLGINLTSTHHIRIDLFGAKQT